MPKKRGKIRLPSRANAAKNADRKPEKTPKNARKMARKYRPRRRKTGEKSRENAAKTKKKREKKAAKTPKISATFANERPPTAREAAEKTAEKRAENARKTANAPQKNARKRREKCLMRERKFEFAKQKSAEMPTETRPTTHRATRTSLEIFTNPTRKKLQYYADRLFSVQCESNSFCKRITILRL